MIRLHLFLICILLVGSSGSTYAQDDLQLKPRMVQKGPSDVQDDTTSQTNKVYDFAANEPEYPGGYKAMLNFVRDSLQYPELAKEQGIQGTVHVQFVIWKDGSIRDLKVIKGVHELLDQEALRLFSIMPDWKPGTNQDGEPINVKYRLPLRFMVF